MIGFDNLITPKILSALYIITVILLLIVSVVAMVNGNVAAAIIGIVLAVFCRIFFECIMVSFKNNEYLRRITEALERKTD
ncbi:DUF4282 domain-containing protein [Phytobacter diazotrophicus]|uniref:DUF4282 domain-containing protein n=1 Tax=Phytobacter diazotrophicus TaxID=395631 RepID=UPI002FEEBC57